ncbi:MAG: DUF364 domain-containing protein [Zestosphaera sp.]
MSTHYDEVCRRFFRGLAKEKGITDEYVWSRHEGSGVVEYRILPPSYFNLHGDEYAIVKGEEVMMECTFKSARAHVFTQLPQDSVTRINEILKLNLSDARCRSLFYCALNAVMRYYGLIEGTIHCRGDSPLKCAKSLVEDLRKAVSGARILLIGYQPAIAEELAKNFSTVYITDMNPRNVGKVIHGIPILSHVENSELIQRVDIVLASGSSLINNTLWDLYKVSAEHGKTFMLYGVSAAGVSRILGIERHCPFSQ